MHCMGAFFLSYICNVKTEAAIKLMRLIKKKVMKKDLEFRDIPLLHATLGDFWIAAVEMGILGAGQGLHIDDCTGTVERPWIVVGIKSLAKELQISTSTINRMLAEGVIDSATYQYGRTLLFDVNTVLDLLRRDRK